MKHLRDRVQELELELSVSNAPVSPESRAQWKLLADQVRAQSKRLWDESEAIRKARAPRGAE